MKAHPAILADADLLAQCRLRFARRSGPGGQHRNKVETAVVLTHVPTGLSAEAAERRSQAENRGQALHRLRVRLAIELRCPEAWPEHPSELWKSRLRGGQLSVSATHRDFPALLAEAMEALARHGSSAADAAGVLACSTTQLVKLLKKAPAALQRVNSQRAALGLGKLH